MLIWRHDRRRKLWIAQGSDREYSVTPLPTKDGGTKWFVAERKPHRLGWDSFATAETSEEGKAIAQLRADSIDKQ